MTAPDLRLGEIEDRLSKATPGPWTAMEYDHNPGDQGVPIIGGGEIGSMEGHLTAYTMTLYNEPQSVADAEFIANAPTDVAYLLAELRKAQDALGRVEGLCAAAAKRGIESGPPLELTALRAAVAAATGGERG